MKMRLPLLLTLPFLAGCAGYTARPLRPIPVQPVEHHAEISFGARVMKAWESITYFGRNLPKVGFFPIQICVQNKSDRFLQFGLNNMNVRTVPAGVVAEHAYQSVAKRVVGYGIPGLIFWPFLIPAVVDAKWAAEANVELLNDYLAKEAVDQVINPGETMNNVVFVAKEDHKSTIAVSLMDMDSQKRIRCFAELY